MKHLKRIFESTEELDTDYIEMCFIDFIDQGCEIEVDTSEVRKYIEFMIYLPGVSYSNGEWVRKNKSKTPDDFYDEINSCIKKVKIKYPNIKVEFTTWSANTYDPFDTYIQLRFMLPKNV